MRQTASADSVLIRVPATTANLGPGFDSLGMALSLWNYMRIGWDVRASVTVHGEGAGHLRRDTSNLIYRAAMRLLKDVGESGRSVRIES
ncbi:MAG: homoserine kinase, partial [Dehalococcoidia bacterium]